MSVSLRLSPVLRRILRDERASADFVRIIRARDGYAPFPFDFEGVRFTVRNTGTGETLSQRWAKEEQWPKS